MSSILIHCLVREIHSSTNMQHVVMYSESFKQYKGNQWNGANNKAHDNNIYATVHEQGHGMLVLSASVSSQDYGDPAHLLSLTRAFSVHSQTLDR